MLYDEVPVVPVPAPVPVPVPLYSCSAQPAFYFGDKIFVPNAAMEDVKTKTRTFETTASLMRDTLASRLLR